MKLVAALIVATIAICAWLASASWERRHLARADLYRADWQRCVTPPLPPITAPAPGKDRTNYRSRDGGIA